MTFVLGLLIGGLVIAAGSDSGSEPEANPTVTASPSSSASADTAVVVPQECVQAAKTVQEATSRIRDGVADIRDFRAQKIVDLLNELEDLSQQANEEAKTCSNIEVTTSDPSPTP